MDLKTPLALLGPTFRMKRAVLLKVGLETVEDFLLYIPFRYENYHVSKIGILQFGEQVTVQGKVVSATNIFTHSSLRSSGRALTIQKITVQDDTGKIDAIFFNQKFILSNIRKGEFVSFAGRVEKFGSKKTLSVRSYEVLSNKDAEAIHTTGLVPVYSETRGLFSKWIRNRIKSLLENIRISEYLPENIRSENNLIDLPTAIRTIHFPKTFEEAEYARARLSFDELLIKHTAALIRKKEWEKRGKAIPFEIEKHGAKVAELIKSLPFELTSSQKRAANEIFEDLFTSSQKPKAKSQQPNFDIAIGTHALIHNRAKFDNLGLVVIDEQQRFGVEQRAILREKGTNPHLLSMTATPIPRTIFLTIYSDLSLSVLDEMPKGRQKIKTWVVPEEKREKGYGWISDKIRKEKSQVFIVCPFIEPSETLTTVKVSD